jgi:RNA polymerase sigma factor (sigma-70 family)
MARPEPRTLLRHIRHLAGPCATAELSDRDLLERFAGRHDEAAFAALVQRRGPLVLQVCRRLLRQEQDAEDVFQATFLVLAKKAGAVRWSDSIAPWLYGVACRLALKARAEAVRRRRQERQAATERIATRPEDLSWREAAAILEEELGRLPERYRAPLLLCCWEGKARDEAARLLGWTVGAVKGRLERGRELLRRRLIRRGVALSAALTAVALAQSSVPGALADATVRTALGAAATVPPTVAGLADAALKALTAAKVKAAGVLLAVVFFAAGAGVWTHQAFRGQPTQEAAADDHPPAPAEGADEDEPPAVAPPAPPEKAVEEKPPEEKPPAPLPWPRADRAGDPLPAGVAERFGTVRFRQADAIQLLAFSPDGKMLATAGGWADPHVYLWDAATGKELHRFELQATSLAFSPGGEMLAAWGASKVAPKQAGLRLWNTKSGALLKELTGKLTDKGPRKPNLLSFSTDGSRLWAFGPGEAGVWEFARRDSFVPSRLVDAPVAAVAGGKAPKYQFLAVARRGGIEGINDEGKGDALLTLDRGTEFTTLAYADNILAGGTAKGAIHVWEVIGGKAKELGSWHSPGGTLLALATADSKDGPRVTSVSAHGNGVEVRVWDPKTAKELSLVKLDGSPAHRAGNDPIKAILSPDGKRVAVAEVEGQCVRLWDAGSGKELALSLGHEGPVRQVAFLPDGKTAASFGADGVLWLWPIGAPGPPRRVGEASRSVQATAISPDGKLAAVVRHQNVIGVFDVVSGKPVHVLDSHPVSSLAFAPDGKSLASGSGSGLATGPDIWRLADKSRQSLGDERLSILDLAYSPDGKLLATADALGVIGLWDVSTGQKVRTLLSPGGQWRHALAFDPPGKVLAVASQAADSVTLYDVATGAELRRCRRPGALIQSLAFARGGRLLVAGSDEGLTLWEVASGAQVLHLTGHRGPVNAVAVSPDGNRVLSGSTDTTVLLWDLAAAWRETAPGPPPGKKPPTPEELCLDLRDDGAIAYRAVWALAALRDKALPALKKELLSAETGEDAERVRRLVADLDDADPKVRNRALEGLRPVGAPAEPVLRKALESAKSDKLRSRLRGFLAELEADGVINPAADGRHAARAADLLELMGTAEARKLLEELAKTGRTAALQREAKAALDRARADRPAP